MAGGQSGNCRCPKASHSDDRDLHGFSSAGIGPFRDLIESKTIRSVRVRVQFDIYMDDSMIYPIKPDI